MTNVREELSSATEHLRITGSETPRLDAELLLGRVLGTDRTGLVLRAEEEMSADDRTRYLALLTRRVNHEPVAYILGRQAFRNIDLLVDGRVLIPRPETEFLVEAALNLPQGSSVLDVGTGSGAVALALKDERPDLEIAATDVSSGALSVARMNASRLRLDVSFSEADLLGETAHPYDAIVANLPYVEDEAQLPPDVKDYEPRQALFGGTDGLSLVRVLVQQAGALTSVKFIALEIGEGQAGATATILADAGFNATETVKDLAGIERVVIGRR